jgi:phosphoserine phosphatase RsbU/P
MQEQMGQRRITSGNTSRRPPLGLIALIPLYITVGLISLFLFLFSRMHKEYLWAGISLVGFGAMLALFAVGIMPQTAVPTQFISAIQIATYPVAAFAMPFAAMYLLGVPRALWRRANYVVALVNLAWSLQLESRNLGLLPPTAATDFFRGLTLWLGELSLGCLLLAIAVDGVRTIGRKAWLPMTPGLLFALYCLSYDLAVSGIFENFVLGEFICASVPISVLVIFLMRFTEQQRENVRMADDMRQAQEVQRLLVPQHLPSFPGWIIESEYRPARQVGGDFFYVLPGKDGSLLVVVGDVSGKGLKAAMTVSAVVGALRDTADRQPARVLDHLNRVLCGQIGGFVTCSATLIAENGAMTIANAGQLSPYSNGDELAVPSGLPLGITLGVSYEEEQFELNAGDRLTFVSDGVLEARNPSGELFGFERTRMISDRPAAEIAAAAQDFGQEDDITVLSVTLTAKLQEVTV